MIGERLRKLRKLKLLSLIQLSEITGISVAAISEIERGVTVPRQSTVKKILSALNIDEKLLYSNDELKLTDLLPNNITDRKIDDVNAQLKTLKSIIEQQQLENQKLTDEIGKLKNRSNQAVFDFNDILKDWDKETQDYLMAIGRIDKTGKASKYSIHMILLDLVKKIKPNDSNKNKDDED